MPTPSGIPTEPIENDPIEALVGSPESEQPWNSDKS